MYSEIFDFVITDGDQVHQTELYEIFAHLLILYHRCKFLVQSNTTLEGERMLAIFLDDFKSRLKHCPVDLLTVTLERCLILHIIQYLPSLLRISELLSLFIFCSHSALVIVAHNLDTIWVQLLLGIDLHIVFTEIYAIDYLLKLNLVKFLLAPLLSVTLGWTEHRVHLTSFSCLLLTLLDHFEFFEVILVVEQSVRKFLLEAVLL